MRFFNHYKTIVISDIPLGSSPAYFKKLIYFIKHTSCDKLIFCGDIAKGWQSKKIDKLYKIHNKFIKTLLKISERDATQIIFVTDIELDYKEKIASLKFSNISFVNHHTFLSGGKPFHVIAGDLSDVTRNKTFQLLPLRKFKYNFLLWLNKKYNLYQINKGEEYYSLLKRFKANLNSETAFHDLIVEYKFYLNDIAIKKECEGIICGHATYSGMHCLGGVTFLSSGYWTETLTALTENNYGKWEAIDFEKIVKDTADARHHAEIMEELFEDEKNMISLNTET